MGNGHMGPPPPVTEWHAHTTGNFSAISLAGCNKAANMATCYLLNSTAKMRWYPRSTYAPEFKANSHLTPTRLPFPTPSTLGPLGTPNISKFSMLVGQLVINS